MKIPSSLVVIRMEWRSQLVGQLRHADDDATPEAPEAYLTQVGHCKTPVWQVWVFFCGSVEHNRVKGGLRLL